MAQVVIVALAALIIVVPALVVNRDVIRRMRKRRRSRRSSPFLVVAQTSGALRAEPVPVPAWPAMMAAATSGAAASRSRADLEVVVEQVPGIADAPPVEPFETDIFAPQSRPANSARWLAPAESEIATVPPPRAD